MSLRINHNISAMNGHRQLVKNSASMSKSLERLSSGMKINRAADDAAGLVISEQMRAQITGLNQAVNNTETAVNMVQSTEGALDEVNSLLNKARELALHAANTGVNDTNQTTADQSELDNVIQSISRISSVTQFGTKKLLDGSLNGTSNLSAALSHVRVGNLANNAGITVGTVNLQVTAGIKEAHILNKSGTATNSYIFSGAVTGVNMGAKKVNANVNVTLQAGTGSVIYRTTGALTVTQLAAKLNTAVSGAGYKYTVSASGGKIKVVSSTVGTTDYNASVSFTRTGTAAIAGSKENITSTLKATGPSSGSIAAAAIFTNAVGGKLSGVGAGTLIRSSGTKFTVNITTATGANLTASYITTGADKSVLTATGIAIKLQAAVRALTGGGATGTQGFTGATVTLLTGVTSGMRFKVTRASDAIATDFNVALTVDYKNNPVAASQAYSLNIGALTVYTGNTNANLGGNATFISGAASGGVTAANVKGVTRMGSGSAFNLTICGQTLTFSGAGRTLTALATAMNTAVHALGGNLANVNVAFTSGGAGGNYSGLAGQVGIAGAIGLRGFIAYSTNGTTFNASMKIDQKLGSDVNVTTASTKTGLIANATLNLTTTAQVRSGNTATISSVAAATVASTSGGSTVVSGADLKATLTTANAVVLNLVGTHTGPNDARTLTLTTGSQALGYKDFKAEITSSLATAGGAVSFTISNGAEFQVGANGLQKVGLTIDSIASTELGRATSTSLSSLDDLLSTKKGALTNGLSSEALKVIDASIDQITNLRGTLGAFQANTLESGLNSLRVSQENLTSAESTIRDVDFAMESANFTRNQILVQASTSMLAQANQMPQSVLKLLG